MRAMLVLCLIAVAAPSEAAQKTKSKAQDAGSREQMCRATVGREVPEGTGGLTLIGQLQVQRFSECMLGATR